ncbi:MAG: hypothetical protein QGM50_07625 [Anaerolineae bacterium]|nr:hypothetical protein [Anaerolineae bacterium]
MKKRSSYLNKEMNTKPRELAYLLAMKIHLQLNDRDSAVRLYKAYSSMNEGEQTPSPSVKMERLGKSLIR